MQLLSTLSKLIRPLSVSRIETQDVVNQYIEYLGNNRYALETQKTLQSLLHGSRFIDSLDSKYVRSLTLNRHRYQVLRAFVNWAALDPEIPVPRDSLQRVRPPKQYEARDRILTEDELRLVCRVANRGRVMDKWLGMLLLTGQRRCEVAGITWGELNDDLTRWSLPGERTKCRRGHVVHLGSLGGSIIGSMKRDDSCPYVFTYTKTSPVSGFSKYIKSLGVSFTYHDIRRTVATEMQGLGIEPWVIEKILNHRIPGVAGVYQRYPYDEEKRDAWLRWENHVVCKYGLVNPAYFP